MAVRSLGVRRELPQKDFAVGQVQFPRATDFPRRAGHYQGLHTARSCKKPEGNEGDYSAWVCERIFRGESVRTLTENPQKNFSTTRNRKLKGEFPAENLRVFAAKHHQGNFISGF
jgi:hypothetical protein